MSTLSSALSINKPLSSVPGADLYRDGIFCHQRASFLSRIIAFKISHKGFAPIEHISSIEVARVRDYYFLVVVFATIPIIIGFLFLLLWILFPSTVIIVRVEGEAFSTIEVNMSEEKALEFVNTYRKLKTHYRNKAPAS